MNRRDFLKTASGVTGTAAVASVAPPAVAQEEDDGNETTSSDNETAGNESDGNETAGGGGGGGGTETVELTGDNVFDPDELYIQPGTTVVFEWTSDGHNIVVEDQPADANWEGHEPIENEGFTYEHTFEVMGEYAYYCKPHASLGMEATITVNESGQNPAASGEGGGEVDPHELGVPFQAHFVGIATILAIFMSLVFSFYVLKYGESPNTSSPNRK
ncbi:plastocyanin/azurin family copper-binding protein [Halostella pelagica]|uniref:plastocyanin/azurin family copper-binding protein n=1 Tax=Halostella pelagica TaxID=2583824 RepID=UPI001081C9F4|nr:plastocyanin/azurin family copper-binding protein [Halostella pelagica]